MIRFNAFQMASVGHQSPGLWAHPRCEAHRYDQPGHWVELAQLLERGLFDGVFIADVLGVYDVYQGRPDAALRHAVQVPLLDPLLLVPLMAQATRHLGFGITCAPAYEHPVPFARRMSTLDHLTGGRVGWNIVTGYLDSAARNLGQARQTAHDERYDIADDYLDVVYKLWNDSWDDDAVRRDKAARVFTDPARVHGIAHQGPHYQVPGIHVRHARPPEGPDAPPRGAASDASVGAIHLCAPSPQRTPVLYQAGTSSRGLAFGAKHAECVFVSGPSQKIIAGYVDKLRSALASAGRPADDQRIYAQALVITGASEAEAREKLEDYRQYIDIEASLALLSGWTGVDFSQFPLDATVEYLPTEAGRTALASFSAADPSRRWTVREAAEFIGLGGRGPVIVGSASQVADQLQDWVAATGIDGFNLTYAIAHETMRDVVQHLVPELQRRGAYPTEYASGTLRRKLFGRGDRLPAHHHGQRLTLAAA